MQFIYPNILFGLFAVIIPIAIHLFNFRRYKKVYFSNVRLLTIFQQRTKRQSQLLHYLVLATRILTICFLTVAFARPFIPSDEIINFTGINAVSLFVDNSFSMETEGAQGRSLDEAKTNAISIASAYDGDDLFQLLTNDFEGRHQRYVSRDEFIQLVREIGLSPSVRSLSEISARQRDLYMRQRSNAGTAYVISDFQKSTLLSKIPDSTGGYSTFLIPVQSKTTSNIYIDTCWFENPILRVNQIADLRIRIKNNSENDVQKIPVRLLVNESQRAVAAVDIPAEGSAVVNLSFSNPTAGIFRAVAEINDYPVIFDDNYYFTFRVSSEIPVLAVNQGEDFNKYLKSVFSLDSILVLSNVSDRQVDYASLPSYRLIILNNLKSVASGAIQELSKYISQGGNLMIFPSLSAKPEELNQLTNVFGADIYTQIDSSHSKVTTLNDNHQLFGDVFEKGTFQEGNIDMPVILRHFGIRQGSAGNSETLIALDNGDPLLTVTSSGSGSVYLSAVPLSDEAGNFPRHSLFVPVMLNIAFLSGELQPFMYYTGENRGIGIGTVRPEGESVFKVVSDNADFEFIPEFRRVDGRSFIFVNDQINQAGFYHIMDGDSRITTLAFNFNRKESDLKTASVDELTALFAGTPGIKIIETGNKDAGKVISEGTSGKNLWKWFVVAALLTMLTESLLLRFFKTTIKPEN